MVRRKNTVQRRIKRKTKRKIQLKKGTNKHKDVKFFMISYKDNADFAKETKKTLFKEWGYRSKIFWGYKIDRKEYTHTNVIFKGIKDKMLKSMVLSKSPVYYIEDDVRFTSDPLNIPKKDVVWSVYRKGKLTNKPPHNVITGSQAIYFSKKAVLALHKHMNARKRAIQIDSYFSEFIRDNKQLSFEQSVPSIGYEETHESLIDKYRDEK